MNVERLEHLRSIMEKVQKLQDDGHRIFDISSWVDVRNNQRTHVKVNHGNYSVDPENALETACVCGTTACAAGWACLDEEFNAQGLELCVPRSSISVDGSIRSNDFITPKYFGTYGLMAIESFLGINKEEALFLFMDASYDKSKLIEHNNNPEPKDVIIHIDYLLTHHPTSADLERMLE